MIKGPVAKFLIPDWGDIINSGIGLSYRPARLHGLAGQYDNPMPESTISPPSGTKNLVSEDKCPQVSRIKEMSLQAGTRGGRGRRGQVLK
jgi:hypothetical protein